MTADPEHILIVKLSAIGDVVMSLPFLEAMRGRFPNARLTWLVEEAAAGIVENHPALDRVVVWPRRSWQKALSAGRLAAAGREIRDFLALLRAERHDLVIDLQGLFKSGVLALASGGRRRLGFDKTRELSYLFLNERLAAYDPDRHALLRYLDVARHLGADVTDPVLRLPIQPAAADAARRLLDGMGRPLAAVNPGAKWDSKLWPAENWRALVSRLSAAGFSLVITGGPDERDLAGDIASAGTGVRNLAGKTSLPELAAVFREVDLVITPDTGPMHLAAAAGASVVALFGPTAPGRTGPFGPGHVVLRAEEPCSPCFRRECPDPRCMTRLTAGMVEAAVWKMVRKQS